MQIPNKLTEKDLEHVRNMAQKHFDKVMCVLELLATEESFRRVKGQFQISERQF
jgi:hypothetical protein